LFWILLAEGAKLPDPPLYRLSYKPILSFSGGGVSVLQTVQSGGADLIQCPAHCQVLGSRFVPLEPIFCVFLFLGLARVGTFCQFHQYAATAADHWLIPPFFGGDFGNQIQYRI